MSQYQMGPIESRFADLIWEKAPVTAAELARETEALLGWKKTTKMPLRMEGAGQGVKALRETHRRNTDGTFYSPPTPPIKKSDANMTKHSI